MAAISGVDYLASVGGGASSTTKTQANDPGRQGFVDYLFNSGVAEGDASYWYQDRGAEEQDLSSAIGRGLQNTDQRKGIVDYLFDQGLAQGDRNYWYEQRGAEDQSLFNTFGQFLGQPLNVGGPGGAPPPPGNPSGPSVPDLESMRAERLSAALAALDAQFNTQAGGLGAERGRLESLFGIENRNLDLRQRDVQRTTDNDAANRGILNSGIYAQNLSEGLGQVANERGDLIGRLNPTEGAEGSEIRNIMSALSLLEQQRSTAQSQAEIDSRSDELDLEQYLALLNAGLSTG